MAPIGPSGVPAISPILPPAGAADAKDPIGAIVARTARPGQSPQDRARDAAEQFVALTFVQPVLKELRESSQAAPPFAPGEGEKQFRALLDAELARRIVHKERYALVDRVARDLLNPHGPR